MVLIGAGYLLGERWGQVEEPLELFKNAVLVGIAIAVAWYVWRRIVRPRFGALPADSAEKAPHPFVDGVSNDVGEGAGLDDGPLPHQGDPI